MYITPNSKIYLLKNVPLSNKYEHTIYFADTAAQTTYFSGLTKYTLTANSYQRVQRGYIRVGLSADDIYDCNYVMFQNTSYGTKWFYAFITGIEYVNNECAEVRFEIDVFQTWFFDFKIKHCFVEREHVADDTIGAHIEPENLELGEYIQMGYKKMPDTQVNTSPVIVAVFNDLNNAASGYMIENTFSGGYAVAYSTDDTGVANLNSTLEEYVQQPDAVISMFMAMQFMTTEDTATKSGFWLINKSTTNAITYTLSQITEDDTINGYKPKNNKLYTYPYNFLHFDNNAGSELNLRYELFVLAPTLRLRTNCLSPVSMTLRPCDYGGRDEDMSQSLQITNYPMCSWNTDAYKAWVAQSTVPNLLNAAGSAGLSALSGAAVGGGVGAIAGAGVSLAKSALSTLSQAYTASISAPTTRGAQTNGNNNWANNLQYFYGGRMCITAQYAKRIDDYFNMFGYNVGRSKVPETHGRPHWNYVKTAGANVVGSVPADDLKVICNALDSGITFWMSGDEVGDYSLDNTKTTSG